jgi:hypothetical protein
MPASYMYKQQDEEELTAASIHYQKPVFTIAKAPLVVGTILHRNCVRAQTKKKTHVRWSALTTRLLFRRTRVKK